MNIQHILAVAVINAATLCLIVFLVRKFTRVNFDLYDLWGNIFLWVLSLGTFWVLSSNTRFSTWGDVVQVGLKSLGVSILASVVLLAFVAIIFLFIPKKRGVVTK